MFIKAALKTYCINVFDKHSNPAAEPQIVIHDWVLTDLDSHQLARRYMTHFHNRTKGTFTDYSEIFEISGTEIVYFIVADF